MSGVVMELKDMEQNYIDFGKETDSDNAINDSRKPLRCKIIAYFILNSLT